MQVKWLDVVQQVMLPDVQVKSLDVVQVKSLEAFHCR